MFEIRFNLVSIKILLIIENYNVVKPILPLSLALFCLGALDASSTTSHPAHEADRVVQGARIETRNQLLAAVNAWPKAHHQPGWTMDELVGRVVDEAFAYREFGPRLDPPVDSFVVCLIKNRRFTHRVVLHTDWTDGIELSSLRRRLPLPAHHTLSINILATPSEMRDRYKQPDNGDNWGILVASVLSGEQPRMRASVNDENADLAKVKTPDQLLSKINSWRRDRHQPELTRAEVAVRLADEALARNHFAGDLQSYVELFLERFAENRRFANPIVIQGDRADWIDILDSGEHLPEPVHDSIWIDVPNMPWDSRDAGGQQLFVSTTQLIVSFAFPPQKGKTKAKQTP